MEKEQKYLIWSFFATHVVLYVITNIFLIIINIVGYARKPWFFAPLFVWGIILAIHFCLTKLIITGYFTELKDKLIDTLSKL